MEAIDELHVKLTTTMPYADLPISLAYPDAKIVPAAIVQGDMARLTRDAVDPQVPGNFERWFAPGAYPLVWLGEPSEMDRRLVFNLCRERHFKQPP